MNYDNNFGNHDHCRFVYNKELLLLRCIYNFASNSIGDYLSAVLTTVNSKWNIVCNFEHNIFSNWF